MSLKNKYDTVSGPREKLKAKGPQALSDLELLQALIGSGNKQTDVAEIARKVNKILRTRRLNIAYDQLETVLGMGDAKICEFLASIELAKRYLIKPDQPIIDSPEKAAEQLASISDKKQEHFVVMTLDGANRMIAKRTITVGTLTASLVHPREVFADAITDRAASIIVAHNHPSGSLKPSESDKEVTKQLSETGKLLGVDLIDHIIITKSDYSSIKGQS